MCVTGTTWWKKAATLSARRRPFAPETACPDAPVESGGRYYTRNDVVKRLVDSDGGCAHTLLLLPEAVPLRFPPPKGADEGPDEGPGDVGGAEDSG